ncbi:MAG: co-chaperone GroES [Phycisphaeraceae bacterium]|nr:co-chaperone GroES [Phycisphaeraceae bacterium]
MKVKPLGDKILVKRLEAETQTASGIYLPESATEKPQQAKVLEVGEGKANEKSGKRDPIPVKKNDTVLLSKWGGTEFKLGDEEMLIIGVDDVLAVVE